MTKKELALAVIEAQSACPEFKQAAKSFIDAIGTDKEEEAGKILLAEAEEDICFIDGTIEFFESEMAVKIFGAEIAKDKLESAKQAKANGAVYCNCPGCTAAKDIIENFVQ
ncbi:MAG: molecular chaperone Hsp90 [Ruminococcaceae bacterium]|nr:molecular chaperone Hsp90 [Oscillospiraceae bacterium]